jgi:glucans biosynthesis protein C
MKREFYIDNLRIFLTALVIIHHTAIAYGASGGWFYITSNTIKGAGVIGLSSMLAVDQAFFMSFFFFISALFTPKSLDRKDAGKFIKDRLIRLGIPLLLSMFVINPSLIYGIAVYSGKTSLGWFDYVTTFISHGPTASHMWFVLTLLIFESIYLLYRTTVKNTFSKRITDRNPSNLCIGGFVAACGILAFSIRLVYPIGGKNFIGLQFGYFGLYTVFYFLGIWASRKNWTERLSYQQAKLWGLIALIVIPFIVPAFILLLNEPSLFNRFIGGFHREAFALAMWEAAVCTGLCYFFFLFFKKYFNRSNQFFSDMAANSYAVYFLHPLFVVGFTMLLEKATLPPFITFFCAATLSITCCFTIAHLIRKIPGIKRVL